MVAAEADGTITVVQQALDALRHICEQQGMTFPGKAELDPLFEAVVVQARDGVAPGPTAVSATISASEVHEDEYEEHELERDDD